MTRICKKKILYLITKSNWGGAQRYVFDLTTHLDPKKFDVVVVFGGHGRLADELTKKNIRTIEIENLERDISVVKEIRSAISLCKILASEKPDVLHINSSKAGGLGAFLGRVLFIPHIIFTAHGWAFNEDRPWWQRIIIKKLHWITILLSNVTIVVSKTLKQQMNLPFIQNKMVVVYNGRTEAELFSRESARSFFATHIPALKNYMNDFWSVTVGELHRIKQHDVTIRALAKITATYPNVRHIIISDGEERSNLEVLVRELQLESHVFFAGHIPEATQYLKAFDLFVLASRSESLAYVLIEACIAGLPSIASNVGGIPEVIRNEHEGLLFPQGDTSALAQAYVRLYEDGTLREKLSENASRRAKEFTFEKMLEKTIGVYAISSLAE